MNTNDDPREVKALWACCDSLQAAGFDPKEIEMVASIIGFEWEGSVNPLAKGVERE